MPKNAQTIAQLHSSHMLVTSLVAQTVKRLSTMGRPGFNPWVGKIHWRRKWQSTPVLLPGKSHGQRSLIGYNPWSRKESDTTEQLHFHFHFHALEKEMATHSSVLACRIPGMGESSGLLSMGSQRVGHDVNFLMFKLVLEKAEEPEIKLPTSAGSWKKQESSRKTSISAFLTMPKPLTVWITINCGKF